MAGAGAQQDVEFDRQVAQLREEFRVLRARDALDSGWAASGKPTPPAED